MTDVLSVDQNAACLGVVETVQQSHDSRLAENVHGHFYHHVTCVCTKCV